MRRSGLAALATLVAATVCRGAEPTRSTLELWAAHNQLAVLDPTSGTTTSLIAIDEVINGVAFSPDGSRAFVGTSGRDAVPDKKKQGAEATTGGLYLIERGSKLAPRRITDGRIKEVHTSLDGKKLFALEWKVNAAPHDASAPKRPARRPEKEPFRLLTIDLASTELRTVASPLVGMDLYDFAVSPDQRTAVLLDPRHSSLRVFDLEKETPVETIPLAGGDAKDGSHRQAALAKLAVSRDGARVATLLNGGRRTGVLLFELSTRKRREALAPRGSQLRAGEFLPDGKSLVLLGIETLMLFDPEAGAVTRSVELPEAFTALALSPNGAEIALGAPAALRTEGARGGGLVEVWNVKDFTRRSRIALPMSVRVLEAAPPVADGAR